MPGPGFKTNKAGINKNGRPKKGYALADLIREVLDEVPKIDPKTKELKLPKKRNAPMKRLFAESLVVRALRSNSASRLVLAHVDGLPAQRVQYEGEEGSPLGLLIKIERGGDTKLTEREELIGGQPDDKGNGKRRQA